MKGQNKLYLNEESLLIAVQEYIDKRWIDGAPERSPIATYIMIDNSSTRMFVIHLETKYD